MAIPSRCSRAAALFVLLAMIAVVASGPSARAQAGADPRRERERVRGERAELALEIDALEADDASLEQAASDIDDNLRAQQALMADADRASAEAVRVAAEAEAAATAKAAELDELRSHMAAFAVDAYVNPPGDDVLDRLKADTASDAAQKQALIDLSATRAGDVRDQLRAARYAYDEQKSRADAAHVDAEERRPRGPAAVDRAATGSGRADTVRQSTRGAPQREAGRSQRTRHDRCATVRHDRGRAGCPGPAAACDDTGTPATPSTSGPSVTPTRPPLPAVPLRTVRGITVNTRIADALESMLTAASADGISLGGSGYRDPSQQIALRKAHCGADDYAIYVMPPFLCTPPTAIPGSSMHEQGLAIDFTWKGASLTSQTNPACQWLAANASRFGFYNLPSEPWHWSVNGK